MSDQMTPSRCISVVLFEGFELLDVFGPVELLNMVPDIRVEYVGPDAGKPVASSQGAKVLTEVAYDDLRNPDILLVPGGMGTRTLVNNDEFLEWLHQTGSQARMVTSVCTGSAVLAAARLLDGYHATSNKLAFTWATSFGTDVAWMPEARWVEDHDRWTSSGVTAGMDMATALIAHLYGDKVAEEATQRAEYEPQRDSRSDPFAKLYGLS